MELRNKLTAFLQNITSFFKSPSHNRTLAIVGIIILAAVIPVTVIVLQQQTSTQQHASEINCTRLRGALCLSYQLCRTNYQYCVTGYADCAATGKVCGYDAGTCRINGTVCSTSGSCCSGYCSGTCKNPPPPPTDSCPSGSIGCRSTGICSQANGLTPVGSGFCHISGQVCCKVYTQPPTPKPIDCATYKFPDGQYGVCAGAGSATYPQCADGKFYSKGPTNCQARTVCCEKSAAVKPPPDYSGCTNFPPDPRTNTTTDKACQTIAIGYRSQCKFDQYYKVDVSTNPVTCFFSPPGTTPSPSPSQYPTCASKTGTCYAGNSCGANSHPIDGVTCPTGTRICCVKDQGSPTTCKALGGTCKTPSITTLSNGTITVGYINANCPSGFKPASQSVSDCSTSQICCIPTSGGGGGGGGGGGNGSCVDPTTKATIAQNHECSNKSICVAGRCVGGCAASGRVCDIPGDTCPAGGGKCVCASGKTTKFAMNITLPGIGTGTFDNHIPKHLARHAAIYVKDSSGKLIVGQTKNFGNSLSHKDGNGPLQIGTFNLKTALACGKTYYVYVKVPGYLTIKQVLTYGSSTQTFAVTAVPGDIASAGTDNMLTPDGNLAGDDKVTIADYNVVRTCRNVDPSTVISFTSGSTKINAKCSDLMNYFDYADGGTQGDEWAFNYNLWLRGFLKANGL